MAVEPLARQGSAVSGSRPPRNAVVQALLQTTSLPMTAVLIFARWKRRPSAMPSSSEPPSELR